MVNRLHTEDSKVSMTHTQENVQLNISNKPAAFSLPRRSTFKPQQGPKSVPPQTSNICYYNNHY